MIRLKPLSAAAVRVIMWLTISASFTPVSVRADGVKDPAYDVKQRLRQEDPLIRAEALAEVYAWEKSPEQFLDDVKRCLQSRSPEVRFRAVRVIGKLAPKAPEAADAIARAFKDRESLVRSAAATAMGRFGRSAEGFADDLGDLITQDADLDVKVAAAEALIVLDTTGVGGVSGLVSGLQSDSAVLQIKCMVALTNIGPPAKVAVPPLTELLRSGDPIIQAGAAKSIGLLAPHGFDPSLVDALRPLLRSEHAQVRLEAVMALGYFGPESRSAGDDIARLLRDRELAVRLNTPIAVAELCDRSYLSALKGARSGETDWRVQKQLDSAIRKVERYAELQSKPADGKVTRNP